MENSTFIVIALFSSLTSLPLFIIAVFYKKINIRDIYKKLIILLLILLNILGTYFLIIKEKIDIIKDNISQGNHEIFLLLIPVFILIGFIIFYILRLSLGKIDIKIFENKCTSGEKLKGEINLVLKKNIQNASLYVYLRGYEYKYSGMSSSGSKSGKWEKKYEDKLILEESEFFESNYSKNYNFSFDIPYLKKEENPIDILKKEYDNQDLSDEQKDKALQLANSFLQFAGVDSGKEYLKLWKIEVRLEKKGIDLFNQQKVNIVRKLKL